MGESLREIPQYRQEYIYLRVTPSAAVQHRRHSQTFKEFVLERPNFHSSWVMQIGAKVSRKREKKYQHTSDRNILNELHIDEAVDPYFGN